MCNTNHFRCWSSPDIIGFRWNMPLLGPFRRRRVLPVLAAWWPQGAQTAGSIPWKIIQFKRKETTEVDLRSMANISSGNSLPCLNKGFCCTLCKHSPLSVPSGTDKVLPVGKMLSPCQGAQGPSARPGCHSTLSSCTSSPSRGGWESCLSASMGCKEGCKHPLGRIYISYLSLALVYGWTQGVRTAAINT